MSSNISRNQACIVLLGIVKDKIENELLENKAVEYNKRIIRHLDECIYQLKLIEKLNKDKEKEDKDG